MTIRVITEDSASGAQVIDGSLRFDSSKSQYLQRTFGSGNRKTYTWSGWVKKTKFGDWYGSLLMRTDELRINNSEQLSFNNSGVSNINSTGLLRDSGSFYHVVFKVDTTQSSGKIKGYINGVEFLSGDASFSTNADTDLNDAATHYIGNGTVSRYADYYLSQVYFIDGQALGPEYFGYTDALTNTWRPKKFKQTAVESFIFAQLDSDVSSSGTSSITLTNNGSATFVSAGTNSFGVTNAVEFNGSNQWLSFSSAPDQSGRNFSVDFYVKFDTIAAEAYAIDLDGCSFGIRDNSGYKFVIHSENVAGSYAGLKYLSAADTDWHHIRMDGSVANGLWIDGVQQDLSGAYVRTPGNGAGTAYIGRQSDGSNYFDGKLAYFRIMSTSIGEPSGSTVQAINNQNYPVTSTNFGLNGFYLPMDGNSPVGQDRSGRGNDWTPVNFSGSAAIDKATGALPILNTTNGGRVATVGVRTDAFANNLVLALPFINTTEYTNTINSAQANIITGFTNNGAEYAAPPTSTSLDLPYATAYALKLNNSGGTNYDYYRPTFAAGTLNFLHNQTGSGTVEFWFRHAGYNSEAVIWGTTNGSTNVGMSAYMSSQTTFAVYISKGTSGTNLGATGNISLPQNEWHHIAITKSTSEVRVYVDGVFKSNFTFTSGDASNSNSTNSYLQMGQNSGEQATRGWNDAAYYRDFRVYNTIKYASNFSIPSTDPDILPDTPSGVAGGSALTKVTDGAIDLQSTGYIDVSSSADFSFGTNPFTVEYYLYVRSATDFVGLPECRPQSTNGNYFVMVMFATRRLGIYKSSTAASDFFISASADTEVPAYKWTHVAYVREGTGSNQAKLYFDGKLVGQGTDDANYTTQRANFGGHAFSDGNFDGLISNIRIVKGSAVYNSEFTPPTSALTNITNTVLLCGQSQTSVTAATVSPSTPTSATAVATNFNPFTTDINAVRGQESGYATLNPLNNTSCTLSEGNLKFVTAGNNSVIWATQPIPTSGKWCFESTFGGGDMAFMLDQKASKTPTDVNITTTGIGMFMYYATGSTSNRFQTNSTNTAFDTSFTGDTVGDVYMFEVDMDNGTMRVRKQDGSNSGLFTMPDALKAAPLFPGFSVTTTWPAVTQTLNFGQKPFKVQPSDGFQPLNAANARPSTVIARPDKYFGTVTYVGSGAARSFNLGFQPDFVWAKGRNSTTSHDLYDSVRGVNNRLRTNGTDIEATRTGALTSFDKYGFSVGTDSTGNINQDTVTMVAWSWKAGGGTGITTSFWKDDVDYGTASAAGLTAGTITPTGASVGTKQGFSIITYTGTDNTSDTFSHGLTQKPDFAIFKNRYEAGHNWIVYHSSLGATKRGKIDLNSTPDSQTSQFNDTEPTSSLFTIGTYDNINKLSNNYISYIWHDVPGLQKFGSYTGNANSNGIFIELGFRPALLWIKSTGATGNWVMVDTKRDVFNPVQAKLYADVGDLENVSNPTGDGAAYNNLDILSNGFKLRSSNTWTNSSQVYIYCAWAEAPSFNLYGAQSNAR